MVGDIQRIEYTQMRRIAMQLIRVKPLRVSIDYRVRIVGPACVGGILATRPHLLMRGRPQSVGGPEKGEEREYEAVTRLEHTEKEIGMKRSRETIPRLQARSPRVHGALASVASNAASPLQQERKGKPDMAPVVIREQEPTEQEMRELQQQPVVEVLPPQPQRRKRSAASRAKEELPAPPPPLTRLKVIRRRGEQAAKVFETVTSTFPSAMLRGVKMEQEDEGERA